MSDATNTRPDYSSHPHKPSKSEIMQARGFLVALALGEEQVKLLTDAIELAGDAGMDDLTSLASITLQASVALAAMKGMRAQERVDFISRLSNSLSILE